jgi:hypothetical protein
MCGCVRAEFAVEVDGHLQYKVCAVRYVALELRHPGATLIGAWVLATLVGLRAARDDETGVSGHIACVLVGHVCMHGEAREPDGTQRQAEVHGLGAYQPHRTASSGTAPSSSAQRPQCRSCRRRRSHTCTCSQRTGPYHDAARTQSPQAAPRRAQVSAAPSLHCSAQCRLRPPRSCPCSSWPSAVRRVRHAAVPAAAGPVPCAASSTCPCKQAGPALVVGKRSEAVGNREGWNWKIENTDSCMARARTDSTWPAGMQVVRRSGPRECTVHIWIPTEESYR